MRKKGWHITRDGAQVTLRRPANTSQTWDVAAQAHLPMGTRGVGRARLAHLIRQDVWRALQSLRGFSPMVQVQRDADGYAVRAGGSVQGAVPSTAQATVQSVLGNPSNIKRWVGALALCVVTSTAQLADAASADPGDLALPSGQNVSLQEVLTSDTEVRFRFVAPDISRDTGYLTYADVELDFQSLCEEFALPWLKERDANAGIVVISMADQETEFGKVNTQVTQFFEAFRQENDRCIWEQF
ncbi:DUF6497 family protein [Nereida sp. MMG025]|uniref:DUF6497 family protein n=1 Tax=Nereida sp. MMG025 TaxID=2909981 RepID=UPI001F336D4F|nr:DUF6497 family protein [Nereida sp. MMG025]MCF6443920.1 DUF6497 family protein [Nereida sp. MMG025]